MKRIDRIIAAIALLGLVLVLAGVSIAGAQQTPPPCMPFKEYSDNLAKGFKQQLISLGMIGNDHVLMVYVSPGGETWTIIAVDTKGIACGIAAGNAWDQGRVPAIGERGA